MALYSLLEHDKAQNFVDEFAEVVDERSNPEPILNRMNVLRLRISVWFEPFRRPWSLLMPVKIVITMLARLMLKKVINAIFNVD